MKLSALLPRRLRPALALTVALLAPVLALAQTPDPNWGANPANIDESTIAVTLYVAPTGTPGASNSNSGLSTSSPLASLGGGIDRAFNTYLAAGTPTKVVMMNGVHTPSQRVQTPQNPTTNMINTLFVLEGETKGQVTINWANVANETGFRIRHPKRNVVIRNIIWANGQNPTVLGLVGQYPYIGDYQDFLVEHCEFTGCGTASADGPAVGLAEVTRLTFRHNYVHDNYGVGFQFIGRQSVIEDCVFTRNELNSNGRAALFVWALDTVIRRVQCNENNGRGFRNDLVGANIFVEDSEFNDNQESGMKWEIAAGPIYITNCEMIGNGLSGDKKNGQGLYIETVYDLTVDGCTIADNVAAQVSITSKNRTELWPGPNTYSGGGTGDLSGAVGSLYAYTTPMYGTKRTTIKNSYIGTDAAPSSFLFAKDTASTTWAQYETWYEDEFTGINNFYESTESFHVFEKLGGGSNTIPDSIRKFVTFAQWQTLTGTDSTSTFTGPSNTVFHPEAEAMAATATGAGIETTAVTAASGGVITSLIGDSVNDAINFTATGLPAGTYGVTITHNTFLNGGIGQLKIDGVNQGSPVDFYNAAPSAGNTVNLGSVTLFGTGNHTLSFVVTGKNASSSSYKLGIDKIDLAPSLVQQNFETESLSRFTTGALSTTDTDAGASNGQRVTMNADGNGDYVTFTAYVTNPGTYNVKIYYKKISNGGISQLAIDGTNVGATYDTYAATAVFTDVTYSGVGIASAGNHTFRFTVTGKNASSSGRKISIDRIELIP